MSRTCSVVDSIDCQASSNGLVTGSVVTCWACGDDTCLACSSVITYPWRGQRRRIRVCFNHAYPFVTQGARMLTADTITDEQIRELRGGSSPLPLLRICAEALSPQRAGCTRRHHARAHCAEILNARNGC